MNDFAEEERRLETFLRENNTEEALRILLDLAIAHARGKDFEKAEHYRDRLYEVDPMALPEIIRANEIIEEEKAVGINLSHRELFSELYEELTVEQANALFYALEEITFSANETVYRQGDTVGALFFVNTGKLRVSCSQGDQNLFVRFLTPGSFFGADTFFASSISTTSVRAVSPSSLHKLTRAAFGRIKTKHPGLEAKLKHCCFYTGTDSIHLQDNNMDRREKTREVILGKASVRFLTDNGDFIGDPIRVDLNDMSPGGASFLFRMANEEKADFMLGRRLSIHITSESESPETYIQITGVIVAVSPNIFDDYSFHLKFDTELESPTLEEIRSTLSTK